MNRVKVRLHFVRVFAATKLRTRFVYLFATYYKFFPSRVFFSTRFRSVEKKKNRCSISMVLNIFVYRWNRMRLVDILSLHFIV